MRRSSDIEPVTETQMSPAIGLDDDTPDLHTFFDQLVLADYSRYKDHEGGCEQGATAVEKQCVPE